ncbi:galactose-1-phosphate uridylyltransferase [Deltaproteobacteria bacterium Smac51]|nr:galactose-1-phosphate uridylyltransferase [Deltaproteobacteria bacterium Smac51]
MTDINHELNRLLRYSLNRKLIGPEDLVCAANHLIALFGQAEFRLEEAGEIPSTVDDILEKLLDQAVNLGLIENTQTRRDLFDTLIMDQVTPRPSEVVRRFQELYKNSPGEATDFFFDFSVAANYVRKGRTDRNISWLAPTSYGDLQITINVSKPEKDPRDIAAALSVPASSYPACLLCRENEGFFGSLNHPARQNLRLIPLRLGGEEWFLQYSPYVYYNEHSIILSRQHRPMKIDRLTFVNLLEFLDTLPHYFAGSNADLPIVGGSILSHDHYQGGRHRFPMDEAPVEKEYDCPAFPNLKLGRVKWPMSTLRLRGRDKAGLISAATAILNDWREWSDESVGIWAYSGEIPHNTITPIARREGDEYLLDLVLRNNRTSPEHPLGIFHPHSDVHHIKKENIGLIEVLGLAILPPRLVPELELIKSFLAEGREDVGEESALPIHAEWYHELRTEFNGAATKEIEAGLREKVGKKFLRVLEHAGVFKRDDQGLAAFDRFVQKISGELK